MVRVSADAVATAPPGRATRLHGGAAWIVVALLCVAVSALNYAWLTRNTLPPHWDAANHMMSALKYHDVLSQCMAQPPLDVRAWKHCAGELIYVDGDVYAPLFSAIGGVMTFAAGNSITALAMTNVPFIAMLLAAMFVMGRRLYSPLAGILAGVLLIAYPLVYQTSREFMFEFAILAWTAAGGCFLMLSERFRRPVMTMLFGVTVGLGALTKFTFLIFLIGPGVYVLGALLVDIVRHRIDAGEATRRLLTLAGALVLGAIVAAVWYGPHLVSFTNSLRTVAALNPINAPVLSWPSLTYYLRTMVWTQMGPPLFLLFLFGVWRFGSRIDPDWRNLLIVWFVSIYAIATSVVIKVPNDDIGILVPAALVSAIGLASIRRYTAVAVTVVCAFVALQLAVLTLPEPMLGARIGTFGWEGVITPFPRTEDWKIEDALRGVAAPNARVGILSDHMFVNGTTFQFFTLKDRLPLQTEPCWRLRVDAPSGPDLAPYQAIVAKSDDEWIKPKADGCFRGSDGRARYAELLRRLGDGSSGFALSRTLPLPDGSSLLVFSSGRSVQPAGPS
jgi:4-amino-4-deoxy-L-arabinose transferase-like glycosyltransferase